MWLTGRTRCNRSAKWILSGNISGRLSGLRKMAWEFQDFPACNFYILAENSLYRIDLGTI